MKVSFRPARLLALVLLVVAASALALDVDDPPPADGSPDARLWKEPCDLDGKGHGELLRVSGSAAGANMSQGRETWRVQLGPDALVELTQEGRLMIGAGARIEERERWSVGCSRGAIRIRAGEAELLLSVAGGAARVDAKWLAALAPEKAKPLALPRLEELATLLDAIADAPEVAGADEAAARVGLLIAERAIDAGESDKAEASLQQAEASRFPAVAAWGRKVGERLDAARGAAPIQPLRPMRLGSLQRLATVPIGRAGEGELGREPDVFWSRSSLCVRHDGDRRDTMRCYDTAAGKWREAEPYASPYAAGPKLEARFLGNPGGYATRLVLQDAGGERVVGDFHSPSILARDARGGLVVRSAGLIAPGAAEVVVSGYDAASGAGSVLVGGGKYFLDGPASLRSVAQPGRSWVVALPGRETGVVCVGEPLTSPDERRAACLAGKSGAPPSAAGYELWIFELGESPGGK